MKVDLSKLNKVCEVKSKSSKGFYAVGGGKGVLIISDINIENNTLTKIGVSTSGNIREVDFWVTVDLYMYDETDFTYFMEWARTKKFTHIYMECSRNKFSFYLSDMDKFKYDLTYQKPE